MTAEDMLPLIEAALKLQHYPLVLWQTGTVEAVRGLQPDGMADVLHAGAELVRNKGGDLVLVDPQFSRFLRANIDLDPYENVMQQVATMPGVALFHRFDLMRTWANDGRIDLEHTPKADRDKALEIRERSRAGYSPPLNSTFAPSDCAVCPWQEDDTRPWPGHCCAIHCRWEEG
jgi:hypothetical protein